MKNSETASRGDFAYSAWAIVASSGYQNYNRYGLAGWTSHGRFNVVASESQRSTSDPSVAL